MQPLGSSSALFSENQKDDEERRLEAFLFGTGFTPNGTNTTREPGMLEGQEEDEKDGLENVMDSDVSGVLVVLEIKLNTT